ncbi:TIGR01777 family oxidoreductase [Alkalihalobacillus deserti]|uniref:TIGR01777 family oxidoreductase n=1 Tax=Alkalihalobacillus deserti TaxID=2879466 RepID=UPI001D1561BD|nr:TIGR01777 family oxidoreductase [Alkalihalobacillus deserti]
MNKKVVIAGGTGFIGDYFKDEFMNNGYEVIIISRQLQHISWEDQVGIKEALEDAEILVNLAGKSVNCRYNQNNKAEILKSRIETTEILGNSLLACKNPPPLWINSSTATIYRYAEDRPMTEEEGEIGSGFSVEVAKEWERSFFAFRLPQTRQVALRIAIALGESGGVMTPMKSIVKFRLGGTQGSGNQQFSWIHLEDLFKIVLFVRDHVEMNGVINCSSPNPITNRELMKQLRKIMNVNVGLPTPKWLLEFGAIFIRTEPELVLKSRWVYPERLEKAGFKFTYRHLEKALQQIIK